MVANDNVALLDDRRRPLAGINPFYAFASSIPPAPAVEDCVEEYIAIDIARVAADSLQEIAENNQEVTPDLHAELVDDSEAMEVSAYAPQDGKEAEQKEDVAEEMVITEEVVHETSEVSDVSEVSENSEEPEMTEEPVSTATPEEPAAQDTLNDLDDMDDLDDLSDLDDLDDLNDPEKDK